MTVTSPSSVQQFDDPLIQCRVGLASITGHCFDVSYPVVTFSFLAGLCIEGICKHAALGY